MDSDLFDLLAIGLVTVIGLFTLLALMVRQDLGPRAGLTREGRWLLTGALGTGLLAFSLKMAVAAVLVQAPGGTVAPLIAAAYRPPPAAEEAAVLPVALPAVPQAAPAYVWEALPLQAPEPADNPGNAAKIALGERLFHETRLSGRGTQSCSSCHDLYAKAGGDRRPTALGEAGQSGPRNTPTVWNAAFQSVLFWDGRAPSLEEQAKGPILNPVEMNLDSPGEAERRLAADPGYRRDFARAFGDGEVTFNRIAQALAAFERTLITPDSAYDRFVRGDATALSQAQLQGMALFESVGCVLCHKGPAFSDASLLGGQAPRRHFPANPTAYEDQYPLLLEDGRRGVWRVPSLRNVALTGPWLHNSSVDRLEEVVRIMASAQLGRSGRLTAWRGQDRALHRIERSPLSPREVADIVAFLNALSSDSLLARQRAAAGKHADAMPAG